MAFKRPTNPTGLTKDQKVELLKDYVAYYEREAVLDSSSLNRKIPRVAFARVINRIGELLLSESSQAAMNPGVVYDFLESTPLPQSMERLLPRDFRAYCLALNALKQWVSAEQAATDRFLLGGTVREVCRLAASHCIVTGEPLSSAVELHHPVRDGRPPLPLSKHGHETVEGQVSVQSEDPVEASLVALKREGNRSWAMLRRGCLDLLDMPLPVTSKNTAASARTFARKAAERSRLSYSEILAWLDKKGR
jgi:hypothetical protein